MDDSQARVKGRRRDLRKRNDKKHSKSRRKKRARAEEEASGRKRKSEPPGHQNKKAHVEQSGNNSGHRSGDKSGDKGEHKSDENTESTSHEAKLERHNNHKSSMESEGLPDVTPGEVTYSAEPPFDFVAQVGQGTYGKVFKAVDRRTRCVLAMKRLRLEATQEGFPLTAAREIRLLQQMRHANIVRLQEIVVSRDDVYIALQYVPHDLSGLLMNKALALLPAHRKSIMQQTLQALEFLHERGVLHRDIKGSNILVGSDGLVKLADFGLARMLNHSVPPVRYTNRVISLWYRPPELLLGAEHYGCEVDVWGAGCLLVEMFLRTPLFWAKDEVAQIQAIYTIMGQPTPEDWPEHLELPWYALIKSVLPHASKYRLDRVFRGDGVTAACYDLVCQLLRMNPAKRITAAQALEHMYFREEPVAKRLILGNDGEWHDWEAKERRREEERVAAASATPAPTAVTPTTPTPARNIVL